MIEVINLTPHTINVCDDAGNVVQSFPSAGQARAASIEKPEAPVRGVPVVSQSFGEVSGLPAPKKGTIYLVSMVVGQALQAQQANSSIISRGDIYGPNTSPGSVVRDENGQIKGVKSFVKYL